MLLENIAWDILFMCSSVFSKATRDIEKLRKDISHLESPDELNNLVPDGGEAESDFQSASKPLELFLRNSVKGGDFSELGARHDKFLGRPSRHPDSAEPVYVQP